MLFIRPQCIVIILKEEETAEERSEFGINMTEYKDISFLADGVVIRAMTEKDYEMVHSLWFTISGFGIRSIDDSKEDVIRFIRRNPSTSAVAELPDGKIIGSILCGTDGRQGSLYHVCVEKHYRRKGIGTAMVGFCMKALEAEKINKVTLIAFAKNDGGNAFWKQIGWTKREDLNYYEFVLNKENITQFIEGSEN